MDNCTIILEFSHWGEQVDNPLKADHSKLSAYGVVACWGDVFNREARSASEDGVNQDLSKPAAGSIANMPRMQGPVGESTTGDAGLAEGAARHMNGAEKVREYGLQDNVLNGGRGGDQNALNGLLNAAYDAAVSQANVFAADCKCMCKEITIRTLCSTIPGEGKKAKTPKELGGKWCDRKVSVPCKKAAK